MYVCNQVANTFVRSTLVHTYILNFIAVSALSLLVCH